MAGVAGASHAPCPPLGRRYSGQLPLLAFPERTRDILFDFLGVLVIRQRTARPVISEKKMRQYGENLKLFNFSQLGKESSVKIGPFSQPILFPSLILSLSADCDGSFVLTKTDSSHKAVVVVVMLKESDLMSHTVTGAEAFGCFCQRAEHSDRAGLCSERTGSRPREHEVKGEVSSWKYRARDRKGRGLPHGIVGPGKSM